MNIISLPDIEGGSDIAFHHGRREHRSVHESAHHLILVIRLNRFHNEHHYEIFTIRGFLREAEASDRHYEYYHRGIHCFNIQPLEKLVSGLTADESFFAQVSLWFLPSHTQAEQRLLTRRMLEKPKTALDPNDELSG